MKKLFLMLVLIPSILFGQDLKTIQHNTSTYVDDFAGIYTPEQKADLGGVIKRFFDTVQISVVTVKSLEGNDISEAAVKLANRWGVGSASNNGLLILIAPSEHKAFAVTGKAIQGDLTDLECARLQREVMVPYFKQKDYFTGTKNLLNAYIARLSPAGKEFRQQQGLATIKKNKEAFNSFMVGFVWFIICMAVLLFIILAIRAAIKSNQDKIEAFDKAWDNYRSERREIADIIRLVIAAQSQGIQKAKELRAVMLNLNFAEPTNGKQLCTMEYFATESRKLTAFKYENSKLLFEISETKKAIDEADIAVPKYNDYINKLPLRISTCQGYISNLRFDKSSYTSQIKNLQSLQDITADTLANYTQALHTESYNSINTHKQEIDSLIKRIDNAISELSNIKTEDDSKVHKAENGVTNIIGRLEILKSYCDKPHVSVQAKEKTMKAISAVREKFTGYDALSLLEKYAMFILMESMLVNCLDEKNEYEAWEREQAAIKKKKEQEEEDDRRRRNSYIAASAVYVTGSSYSSSDSDSSSSSSSYSSSSDSSSDSSFGGGSFDGGGGGSDW